ncbi:MAG: D-glycero-beta-D-manno-heptose-7-phosphate kinase [Acetobacteraceae bacterium]|nr:D-glycero-beta-D-manno-heptose-7-phosphate kinase [Acetobacteraceae bacterium]
MDEPVPDDRDLAGIVRQFGRARVLVVGDVILDRYRIGDAHRLSPEAPIPVLRPRRQHDTAGGAANVAMNIATLGGHAILAGVIGDDDAGKVIVSLLRDANRVASALIVARDRPTTAKTRFIAGAQQLLRLDEETTAPLDPVSVAALLERVKDALRETDIVVLSDYAKGVLCDAVLEPLLTLIAARGKPVIADPKRPDFRAYRGVTVLTPNELEVRAATNIDALFDTEADRAGRAALEATRGEAVLVTRSAKGLTLARRDKPALHFPARARAVADVSGAGDTLVAALAVAMAAGASLTDAAMLANVTAGISVGKPGTATVSQAELLNALHTGGLATTDRKVLGFEEAKAQAAGWRAQGLKVGFANGCFDLIHPGHVHLLTQARAGCDRLIVALNTDASVRRLKGPTRPIQNEGARAIVMASLSPVDMVMLFDEDTPLEMIQALRPDVLIKGSDYTVDQVVGGDLVQGWGGKVLLVDLREGHSTSGTIRRMTLPPE